MLAKPQQGDRITFSSRVLGQRTRVVKAVTRDGARVKFGKTHILVPFESIREVSPFKAHVKEGVNKISLEMFRKGITNEALGEKAGYSCETISNIRVGKQVKPRTLADVWQALESM